MANPNPHSNTSICRKNDMLINDGKPRNRKELDQLRTNQKKKLEQFDPVKHIMVKHPTIKNSWLQVNR